MDALTLRKVDAADAAVFFSLFAAVRAEELRMDAWSPEERSQMLRFQFDAQRRGHRAQFPGADECLIVLDGTPVGWCVVDRSGQVIRCVDIAVAGEGRGRGVGTRVLRALQDDAAAVGWPLELTVLRTNVRAAALYTRLGFRIVGGTDTHHLMEWRCE
jgi:ribosomal protein S18 acetylase RimI-like enzyme